MAEELLELLGGLPFIDDHDETVANPEPMVNTARRTGHVGDLRELASPISESLAELGSVALEFPDDQHAHALGPPNVNSARLTAHSFRQGYVTGTGGGSPVRGAI